MDPPGPDDPRYWERMRKTPPDEWVRRDSPEWKRMAADLDRRERLHFRIFCLVVGALLAGVFAWGVVTQTGSDDPRYDAYEFCQDERGVDVC